MEKSPTIKEEESLFKKFRAAILPVKASDPIALKLGKNLAFGIFLILFACVTLSITVAILFAL